MKKIKFTCASCNAKLRVPTHLAGVSAPCPKCGSTITAPTDLENVVEDEPSRAERKSRPAPAKEKVLETAVAGSPASASKVSSTVKSEADLSRVVPAPPQSEVSESSSPEPVLPELPLDPPVSSPVQEEAIIEETVLFDPPAPEGLEEEQAVASPSPVPMAPPPPAIASPEPAEEEVVETELASPPPVPITQPIKVNPKPSHLPAARGEELAELGELPRLDVNLADHGEAGPDSFARNPSAPEGPLRVQLSQPGEAMENYSPDDFIVTPGQEEAGYASEEAVSEQPAYADTTYAETTYEEPVYEESAYEEPAVEEPEYEEAPYEEGSYEETASTEPTFEDDMGFELPQTEAAEEPSFMEPSGIPLDQIEEPEVSSEEQGEEWSQDYVPLELPPIDSHEEVVEEYATSEDEVPQGNFIAEAAAAQEMAAEGVSDGEVVEGHLDEGSFENLLAQQSHAEGQESSAEQASEVPVEGVMTFDSEPVSQEAVPATGAVPVKSERDVLDEMFGDGQKTGEQAKRSTILMLSILGATAIVAIIGVGILIKAMGGLSVEDQGKAAGKSGPPVASNTELGTNAAAPANAAAKEEIPSPPEPSITDAPAIPDQVAQRREDPVNTSTVTLPGEMAQPVRIVDSSKSSPEPAAGETPPSQISPPGNTASTPDSSALSFDERVQQIVNGEVGNSASGSGPSVIGGGPDTPPAPADPVESALQDLGNSAQQGVNAVQQEAEATLNSAIEQVAPKSMDAAAPKTASANYNPLASFAAPGPDDGPLGKTHDLLDAFLRAPDWETRVKYCYGGESLRPAMEEYYKKWEMKTYDRFSKQLFQMEQDASMGGPYWVFLVSTSDEDQGFPVIIRVEDGLLKVDWEIYSEFEDRHFVQFQKGAIASPHTFRLVVERVSDYYGSDRDGFEDLGDYYVYQINPPYGDLNEFSDYAFVKSDSEVAKKLDEVVGLGEQPLAVIVTLSQDAFSHGVKHLVIKDYVTEGWFR